LFAILKIENLLTRKLEKTKKRTDYTLTCEKRIKSSNGKFWQIIIRISFGNNIKRSEKFLEINELFRLKLNTYL